MSQTFDLGIFSDVGMVRAINEDNCVAIQDRGVFVVADGMGGHSRGDLASQIAVDTLEESIREFLDLDRAIRTAHNSIKEVASTQEGAFGMGTTAVVAHITEQEYEVQWVGDSRAYIWDQTSIHQITVDHTYVQELYDSGLITKRETFHHPQKHLLTSSLGASSDSDLVISSRTGFMSSHDIMLLCSDGVTNEISDQQLMNILSSSYMTNQEKSQAIIEQANRNGGHDNSTAIVISFTTASDTDEDFDENFRTQQSYSAIAE